MPSIIIGEISPGGIGQVGMQGSFTKIDIQDGAGWHTIWQNGQTLIPSLEVVAGKSWELHCYARYYSPVGMYAVFATIVVNGIPALSQGDRDEIGGSWVENNHIFGANMGIVPASGSIVIQRIKLWMTSNYTTVPPPSSKW